MKIRHEIILSVKQSPMKMLIKYEDMVNIKEKWLYIYKTWDMWKYDRKTCEITCLASITRK